MEDSIYYNKISDIEFADLVQKRNRESVSHWDKEKSLKSVREKNNKEYLGKFVEEQLVDERYQDIYSDNRQFTSVRTIVPFLAARVTAPEVTPANGNDLSVQFAEDFEQVLQKHADKQNARAQVRLAIQDLLRGERVGVIKMRLDGAKNTIIFERVKPSNLVIGKRSKLFEEPDYVGETIKKTIGEMLRMFPDKEDKIRKLFGIPSEGKIPLLVIQKEYKLTEEWMWVDTGESVDLVVGWRWQNEVIGKIEDPNWNKNGKNLIECQMVPYIFFNFLNDGSGYIDETSFMEQAHNLQTNYNKRGQTIADNAKYGGTGVPIFSKKAIDQKNAAKIKFSPVQRVLLDSDDVGRSFTTWKSDNLPQYIVEDKYDDRNSIDNTWGTPNVFRGEQSKNNTLGQDVIVRDQAEGRLSDPVDCIDDSMTRFYQLLAQMMYRYFDEKKFYNYKGNDGKFVSIAITNAEIAKNIGLEINVKAGTSLPIDRAQKRATVMKLVEIGKVGTLTAYKELGIFDDPEAAYKEYVTEQVDPAASISEVDKKVFSREAYQDLLTVLAGKKPEEREDINEDYINFLTNWLLTDKYMILQQSKPEAAAKISEFVDGVIAKAQRKLDKMQLQPQPETAIMPPEQMAAMGAQQSQGQPQPEQPPVPVPM